MKSKRVLTAILAGAILLTTGCSSKKVENEENGKISYWLPMNSSLNSLASNLGDTPFGQKLQEATGVTIEFIHPTNNDQFALMLASGELPDIIEADWGSYNGGAQRSLSEGYIMKLNDVIADKAPNLKAYLAKNPEIDRMVKTNDGDYYVFPFIRGDEYLLTSTGAFVRKDWLDELGIEELETMDEWYNMLLKFKEVKGAEMPLSFMEYKTMFNFGVFTGAYGVTNGFYIMDGEICYGPIESGYKEFLAEMCKWYGEGLLDTNFMNVDQKTLDTAVLNGQTGAVVAGLGGGMGKYLGASTEEGFDLCGLRYPVKNKGDRPMFSSRQNPFSGYGAAISKNSKNVDLAAKVLDYCYSEEGKMLNNFGIEGESYEMIDGYPRYTELITNNKEGLAMANVMSLYVRSNFLGSFIQDKRYMEQYSSLPQQQDALQKWMDTDAEKHNLPLLLFTSEQSAEIAEVMSTIETYQDEQMIRFIMGTRPIEEFDSYVSDMKSMGIERLVEIYQDAYNSYISR